MTTILIHTKGNVMATTIISIMHTHAPAEKDILENISQHLCQAFVHDTTPTCETIIYDDFDTAKLPDLQQRQNPIVILAGVDSITTLENLDRKNHSPKCLIWIATESLSEAHHKTVLTHADIILKPRCVDDSSLHQGKSKILHIDELPHNVDTPALLTQMQQPYYQDAINHTQEMGKPKKTCWNLFFKAEQPTPVVALLGGSNLMMDLFTKEVAQNLANHIISKWKGKRFYVVVVSDRFTSQESRDAFTLILELNKTPYITYDDKRLLAALAYVSQRQGHIVLTDECLWKLSICTHIEKLPLYPDNSVGIENPIMHKADEEEIVFEPNIHREQQKLQPVPIAPPGKIVPYVLQNPNTTRSCQSFLTQAISKKNARALDSKPLWRDRKIDTDESNSPMCDFSTLADMISVVLPELKKSVLIPA